MEEYWECKMVGAVAELEELVRCQGLEDRRVVGEARAARFLPPGCRWSCLVNLAMLGVQVGLAKERCEHTLQVLHYDRTTISIVL